MEIPSERSGLLCFAAALMLKVTTGSSTLQQSEGEVAPPGGLFFFSVLFFFFLHCRPRFALSVECFQLKTTGPADRLVKAIMSLKPQCDGAIFSFSAIGYLRSMAKQHP